MTEHSIALYSQARELTRRLCESNDLQEVLKIGNQAGALRHLHLVANDPECDSWMSEIRIRAQRRVGELCSLLHKSTGDNLPNVVGPRHSGKREVLKAAGLSKDIANRCEQLARVPQETFEALIKAKRDDLKPILAKEVVQSHAAALRKEAVVHHADSPELLLTSDLDSLVTRGLKFGTIYADPPWQYDNQATRGATSNSYRGMPLQDIAALPVSQLAAEQAHLHLWTTTTFMFAAKDILEAWGFEYKTFYVWVKKDIGLGNYWRGAHEIMLLGVRGALTFEDHSLRSWGEFPRQNHSAKPPEVRALIELASPGPRLELFGRKTVPGWVVWGNETNRDAFNDEAGKVEAA